MDPAPLRQNGRSVQCQSFVAASLTSVATDFGARDLALARAGLSFLADGGEGTFFPLATLTPTQY